MVYAVKPKKTATRIQKIILDVSILLILLKTIKRQKTAVSIEKAKANFSTSLFTFFFFKNNVSLTGKNGNNHNRKRDVKR